jgi:hypothetical protein
MKYFILFILSIILIGCSGSKELELTSINQQPCRNETTLNNPNEFVGETAENMMVYQQGNQVIVSADVRAYCNSRISFEVERDSELITLRLLNNNSMTDKCVCYTNVSTSIVNLKGGRYTILLTDRTGRTVLSQQEVSVKD